MRIIGAFLKICFRFSRIDSNSSSGRQNLRIPCPILSRGKPISNMIIHKSVHQSHHANDCQLKPAIIRADLQIQSHATWLVTWKYARLWKSLDISLVWMQSQVSRYLIWWNAMIRSSESWYRDFIQVTVLGVHENVTFILSWRGLTSYDIPVRFLLE